jgi:hypothetical protein
MGATVMLPAPSRSPFKAPKRHQPSASSGALPHQVLLPICIHIRVHVDVAVIRRAAVARVAGHMHKVVLLAGLRIRWRAAALRPPRRRFAAGRRQQLRRIRQARRRAAAPTVARTKECQKRTSMPPRPHPPRGGHGVAQTRCSLCTRVPRVATRQKIKCPILHAKCDKLCPTGFSDGNEPPTNSILP